MKKHLERELTSCSATGTAPSDTAGPEGIVLRSGPCSAGGRRKKTAVLCTCARRTTAAPSWETFREDGVAPAEKRPSFNGKCQGNPKRHLAEAARTFDPFTLTAAWKD